MLQPDQVVLQIFQMPLSNINQGQALEIYERKLSLMKATREELPCAKAAQMKKECLFLAKRYLVSPKSIREVWNRRTWVICTSTLWEEEVVELFMH